MRVWSVRVDVKRSAFEKAVLGGIWLESPATLPGINLNLAKKFLGVRCFIANRSIFQLFLSSKNCIPASAKNRITDYQIYLKFTSTDLSPTTRSSKKVVTSVWSATPKFIHLFKSFDFWDWCSSCQYLQIDSICETSDLYSTFQRLTRCRNGWRQKQGLAPAELCAWWIFAFEPWRGKSEDWKWGDCLELVWRFREVIHLSQLGRKWRVTVSTTSR